MRRIHDCALALLLLPTISNPTPLPKILYILALLYKYSEPAGLRIYPRKL